MSAQITAALHSRADALETGAQEIENWVAFQAAQGIPAGSTRDPDMLRFLAQQFRLLANVAEGPEPQTGEAGQ